MHARSSSSQIIPLAMSDADSEPCSKNNSAVLYASECLVRCAEDDAHAAALLGISAADLASRAPRVADGEIYTPTPLSPRQARVSDGERYRPGPPPASPPSSPSSHPVR
jgi:hypothetical protein